MKLTTLIISTFLIFFGLASCNNSNESIFSDEISKDTIRQNIGGILIRDIHYWNDFQSWDYEIDYTYKDKFDSIHRIGKSHLTGQELPVNEQLLQVNNWTILSVNTGFSCEIITTDLKSNISKEYEISPQTIEQEILWKSYNISSSPDNGDSKVTFEKINANGEFSVIYVFAKKDRIFSFMTGKRRVNFIVNIQTGRPEMTDVTEL
ncbi:MAG: hypothetical protein V4643_14325 [Bacteroidota bacterium]